MTAGGVIYEDEFTAAERWAAARSDWMLAYTYFDLLERSTACCEPSWTNARNGRCRSETGNGETGVLQPYVSAGGRAAGDVGAAAEQVSGVRRRARRHSRRDSAGHGAAGESEAARYAPKMEITKSVYPCIDALRSECPAACLKWKRRRLAKL